MSKTTQVHVPAIHYEEGQNLPNMKVGCIFQTPSTGGFAYALLYSECGKLVIQRARVGSAILTKAGKPHVRITDILTVELGDLLGAAADVFTAPEGDKVFGVDDLVQPGDMRCDCGMTMTAAGRAQYKTCPKCAAPLVGLH